MTKDYFVSAIACIPWVGKTRKGSTENNHSNNIHFWIQLGRTTAQLIKRTGKKNDDNRSTLYKLDTSLRSRQHVSGYFGIRKFFFPDSKISTSTHSVFKLNFLLHKYADSLSFRQLVWKVKKKKKKRSGLMRNCSHHSSAKKKTKMRFRWQNCPIKH